MVDRVSGGSETPGEGLRGLAALLAHEQSHHRETGQGENPYSLFKDHVI